MVRTLAAATVPTENISPRQGPLAQRPAAWHTGNFAAQAAAEGPEHQGKQAEQG
jgi:hypothetical protein